METIFVGSTANAAGTAMSGSPLSLGRRAELPGSRGYYPSCLVPRASCLV